MARWSVFRRARPRILAFTCSRQRPLMLRHCILQMQAQTRPPDHAIYVNASEPDQAGKAGGTALRYDRLLDDLRGNGRAKLMVGYGPTGTSHSNYLNALKLVDIDAYDLFLKVDDDDIYLRGYVQGVADDFVARRWDYSGTASTGLLNGHRWHRGWIVPGLGLSSLDRDLDVPDFMPPSAAFSRKAIRAILDIEDNGRFEDQQWRRHLAQIHGMDMTTRSDTNFIYNVHGGNVSTAHSYRP